MATKKSAKSLPFFDFSSWNFIIFLLLGFVLIVLIAVTLKGGASQLGVKAGFACPQLRLRNPNECPQGWKVDFKTQKCPQLVCPISDYPLY